MTDVQGATVHLVVQEEGGVDCGDEQVQYCRHQLVFDDVGFHDGPLEHDQVLYGIEVEYLPLVCVRQGIEKLLADLREFVHLPNINVPQLNMLGLLSRILGLRSKKPIDLLHLRPNIDCDESGSLGVLVNVLARYPLNLRCLLQPGAKIIRYGR